MNLRDRGSGNTEFKLEARGADSTTRRGENDTLKLPISVSPKKVALVLALLALGFTFASFFGGFLEPVVGRVVELFSVGSDLSAPSWYASILLLFAAVLISAVTFAEKLRGGRYVARWGVLAAIFVYLSSDEMLRLHERMSGALLQPALEAIGYEPTGLLRYPWVIVYAPLTLVFVLAYLRFWLDLPGRIRNLFFVAGFLFVGGALGVEMVNALIDDLYGSGNLFYSVMTHLEELMEMLGIVVFVYALMSHIGSHLGVEELQIRIKDKSSG